MPPTAARPAQPGRAKARREAPGPGRRLARHTAVHKATGKPLNVRVAHYFTVRGGLVVRFEQFVDTALVRDAATA